MSNSTSQDQTSSADRYTGCVKWFDNALNYGFITVISPGEHHGKDIFVHQSGVQTRNRKLTVLLTVENVSNLTLQTLITKNIQNTQLK